MVLCVDETENEEFFIVTGLLVNSKEDVDLAYRQFKNKRSLTIFKHYGILNT